MQQKPMVFQQFQNRARALQSDLGRPKGPPREPLFFSGRGQVGVLGPPKKVIAPPGPPFGAKEGVNDPPGALKRRTVQVKVFKTNKRFP